MGKHKNLDFNILEEVRGEKKDIHDTLHRINNFIIDNHDKINSLIVLSSADTPESDKYGNHLGIINTEGDPYDMSTLLQIMFGECPHMLDVAALAIIKGGFEEEFKIRFTAMKLKSLFLEAVIEKMSGDEEAIERVKALLFKEPDPNPNNDEQDS